MSRAAVYELLKSDPVLSADPLLIGEKVFQTFTMQGSRQAPADGCFLILRWEETLETIGDVRVLTIWCHRARTDGVDFRIQDLALSRCKELLLNSFHLAGSDGSVMTQATFKGMGPDNVDEGYDTTVRYAVFEINSKVGA